MANLSKSDLLRLESYKTCLDYLYHDDNRKADFFKLFSLAEGGLVVLLTWAWDRERVLVFLIGAFAVLFSAYWTLVIERMRAVIGIRYDYLCYLEEKLKYLEIMTLEDRLKKAGRVEIGGRAYKLGFFHKISATKAESVLPFLVTLFWLAILLVAIIL